jgi:hypothetical protein
MPEQNLQYDARHAVSVIYSGAVSKHRFVSWAGAHATDAASVQGVSEIPGPAGKAGSLVTGYSYLVEAAAAIPAGSAVAPSSDGTGRAIVATGLQCGRALTAAAAAGELLTVCVLLQGGGLTPAKAAASDALVSTPWKNSNSGRALVDAQAPIQHWGGQIIAADYTISSGSPTVSVVTRNGQQCLKVVTGAGVTANVDLALIGDVGWWGRAQVQAEGTRTDGVDQIAVLMTPDNFTNFATGVYTTQTTPLDQPREQGGVYTMRYDGQVTSGATAYQLTGSGASWGAATPTLDGSTATVNKIRFRVIPVSGQVATVYLYGISLSPRRRKGRVFVTFDDGYKSFMQLLAPIFMSRGIPLTFGCISSLMDDRVQLQNYMTWNDCRQIVAAGGQVVAHGPLASGGAGNLIDNITSTALRVADMDQCRAAIAANGCATLNYERVYVWPQGRFQTASNDLVLLDAAIAAGFTVGRTASPITNQTFDFSGMSRYQRLALPIIGHTYAGGSESTNITTLTTAIGAAGAVRADLVLMLHKGVKNADTPDTIGITVANAITLADAIVTEMTNGRLQPGVLGDLAEPSVWAS